MVAEVRTALPWWGGGENQRGRQEGLSRGIEMFSILLRKEVAKFMELCTYNGCIWLYVNYTLIRKGKKKRLQQDLMG